MRFLVVGGQIQRRFFHEIIFVLGAIDKKGYLIITFPSSAAIEKLNGEELKKLIIYLASIK